MDLISLLVIAIGLTFDTFAVSVTIGLMVNHIRFWQATRLALVMAFFQALMPLIGWMLGLQVKDFIEAYDHWIALVLLTGIGLKMIHESFKNEAQKGEFNPFLPMVIIGMSLATSIDALVVGVTFAFVNVNIVDWHMGFMDMNMIMAAFIIGVLTYLVAMLGMLFGKKTGALLGRKMEIVGGVMLIAIGVKIALEHYVGNC
jgi:putative Mn2+ efflux pump MntP